MVVLKELLKVKVLMWIIGCVVDGLLIGVSELLMFMYWKVMLVIVDYLLKVVWIIGCRLVSEIVVVVLLFVGLV